MNLLHMCPICGYDELELPVRDNFSHNICPSCRTHLGYTDSSEEFSFEEMHLQLRQKWIDNGMPWRSSVDRIPIDWNPKRQLENLLSYLLKKSNNPAISDGV